MYKCKCSRPKKSSSNSDCDSLPEARVEKGRIFSLNRIWVKSFSSAKTRNAWSSSIYKKRMKLTFNQSSILTICYSFFCFYFGCSITNIYANSSYCNLSYISCFLKLWTWLCDYLKMLRIFCLVVSKKNS